MSLDVEAGTCRACGAPVFFVRSGASEARLILDASPKKRIVVFDQADAGSPQPLTRADVREMALPALFDGRARPRAVVVDTWLDHHTLCPMADQFRRDKART